MTRRRIHRARGSRRVATAISLAATAGIFTVLSAQDPAPAAAPLPPQVTPSDAVIPATAGPSTPTPATPTAATAAATPIPATPNAATTAAAVPTIRLTADPVLQAAPAPQAAVPNPAVRTSGSN